MVVLKHLFKGREAKANLFADSLAPHLVLLFQMGVGRQGLLLLGLLLVSSWFSFLLG
jgi:hypothetical protein